MALTGELSDLSLAELIEFFCNQRKTGRLKVIYKPGPGYFYLQSGSVVHARVGELRGIEAVYYALTQRNAQFNFSPSVDPPELTINQPWTSVVLEGLRRMDEGIKPANPFPEGYVASVEDADATPEDKTAIAELLEELNKHPGSPRLVQTMESRREAVPSFLASVESSSNRSWKVGAVFASVFLVIAGVAVPWGLHARKVANAANEPKPAVATEQPAANSSSAPSESPATQPGSKETAASAPNADAELAKRQREARLKEEARKKSLGTPTAPAAQSAAAAKPQASPAAGSKKVTVTVTYDENGRVTQASGGDATALRIARQKRFPVGKAGSATITIPIN